MDYVGWPLRLVVLLAVAVAGVAHAQITGHKTRAVFERYNIGSEGDVTDAARQLDNFAGTIAAQNAAGAP